MIRNNININSYFINVNINYYYYINININYYYYINIDDWDL